MSPYERPREVVLWEKLMEKNVSNPIYRHLNVEEFDEITMTARQIPDFINLLKSDNADKRTKLCIKKLIDSSQEDKVSDYLRNNRKTFLEVATCVMRRDSTEEQKCAVICLLYQLIFIDKDAIDTISKENTEFTINIINIFRWCDMYYEELLEHFSKLIKKIVNKVQVKPESPWKLLLKDMGSFIVQGLRMSDDLTRGEPAETINKFQVLLESLRALYNLERILMEKGENSRTVFENIIINTVFEINIPLIGRSNCLKILFETMISIFRDKISVDESIVSLEQWHFIYNWLPIIIYIGKIDECLDSTLFHEDSENYLKVMDVVYKICAQFNENITNMFEKFYAYDLITRAFQKTIELLTIFCIKIGVPVTLSIMFLTLYHHLENKYDKITNGREKNDARRIYMESFLDEIKRYWLLIVEKCSWLHIMGILDLTPTQSRIFAIKTAIDDKSALSTSRKIQMMKVYNYILT